MSGSTLIVCLIINRALLAADPGIGGGLGQFLLPLALIAPIWYFLVIRPQQQQRRKLQDMISNLKTGDKVVTSGGIYGTVVGFRDSVVQVQIASQVKVDMARSAITGMVSEEAASADPSGKTKK